ncbi:hypothetical protein E0E50_14560 [Azotobacter chroococcum subsp. isscasi]|nr:hypothetical protein E0E50_14560 [Azotobacter chroococcum subsp. isscasi]
MLFAEFFYRLRQVRYGFARLVYPGSAVYLVHPFGCRKRQIHRSDDRSETIRKFKNHSRSYIDAHDPAGGARCR